jgi:dihydroorotase
MKNYIISGGTVFDGSGADGQRVDVRVRDGNITEIAPNLQAADEEVIDASGHIVTPGLVDLHVHVFAGIGRWSIDIEDAGLKTGVTTVLDTGTAGALTYAGFDKYVISKAREDIFALLNISMLGCLQGHPPIMPHRIGELADPRFADVPSAIECVQKYPERIVGMKARLSSGIADGKEESEQIGFTNALEVAATCNVPLMVHHAGSRIPLTELLTRLQPGDIYTHLYHPHRDGGFVDESSLEAMQAGRERGIIFDVGHGKGAFSWETSERACQQYGFWPDTISTDVHAFNWHGPVWDLPTTMSKFLHLGMPLAEVVRASTHTPARALRKEDRFGLLQAGRQADITLLRLDEAIVPIPDVLDITRDAKRLVPVRVWKRGEMFNCTPADLG